MIQYIDRYFPDLSEQQLAQFDAMLSLYPEWNAKINVISRKDIDNLEVNHILHSLAIAKFISFAPGSKILDFGCGGGCERQHRGRREYLAYLGNLAVGGTEIVSPLRDAVCLVDCNHFYIDAAYLLEEYFGCQSFGRDIEELVVAEDAVLKCRYYIGMLHSRIDSGGFNVAASEVGDLVLHEGHKRGYDKAETIACKGRDLESDALAAACGHQPKSIVSGTN